MSELNVTKLGLADSYLQFFEDKYLFIRGFYSLFPIQIPFF